MSDAKEDFSNFYSENYDDDLDNKAYQPLCKTIEDIKFRVDKQTNIFGTNGNYYQGKDIKTNKYAIVREIFASSVSMDFIENDFKTTDHFENQNITYILNIRKYKTKENCVYFFYEPYEYTFRQFFEVNKEKEINEDVFKSLVRELIKAIALGHSQNIVFNNISLENVAIKTVNGISVPKIFNLSMAKKVSEEGDYLKDIKDFGMLLLSIFAGAEGAKKIIGDIQHLDTSKQKFERIFEKVKDAKWISPKNIRFFADLILCLVVVKLRDNPSIQDFKKHIYFWDDERIKHFISLINGRVSLSNDVKNKDQKKIAKVQERVKVLSAMLPNINGFKEKLPDEVKKFFPDSDNWSEFIRVLRNKIAHHDDDTDCEDNSQAAGKTDESQATKKQKKPNKDPEALAQLTKLFERNGGPLNYFQTTLDDLLYYLFDHFRLHADHLKLEQFYPKTFLFEDPKEARYRIVAELESIEPKKIEPSIEKLKTSSNSKNISPPNKPPNISSECRNDQFREDASRVKKIKGATKKKSYTTQDSMKSYHTSSWRSK